MGYKEEFVVVPFVEHLGSVGGNLSMFIQFPSFSYLVTILLAYISTRCIKFKHGGKFFYATSDSSLSFLFLNFFWFFMLLQVPKDPSRFLWVPQGPSRSNNVPLGILQVPAYFSRFFQFGH